jgi:hypothetical protein
VKILSENKSRKWVLHYFGTQELADNLSTGITDRAVACSDILSLSLFRLQKKRTHKFPNMTKQDRHLPLHHHQQGAVSH